MHSIFRKGLFLFTITGAITAFPMSVLAADDAEITIPQVGIEAVLNDVNQKDSNINIEDYLVPEEKGEYLDMAFADVDSFLYVRSEPSTDSEWVGKLYPDYAAEITGPVGEWTKIQSGSVTGYVYSDYIIVGERAQEKAEEIIANSDSEDPEDAFCYAESREEEEARLQKEEEEAAQKAKEAAATQSELGQQVVEYACQFIGNPYVWGGTSLTEGADCSGFVQSVFAHFGVSLPRTTWDMESSGTEVSYDQAIAGDIILYDGHVGIYMGDGQIVNAINSEMGIGILSATYADIVTVRRLL
jgi:cell wall-associated NlpC family hydrolase